MPKINLICSNCNTAFSIDLDLVKAAGEGVVEVTGPKSIACPNCKNTFNPGSVLSIFLPIRTGGVTISVKPGGGFNHGGDIVGRDKIG